MKEYQGKLEHSAENAVCFPDVSRGSSFSSELKVDLELKGRIVDVQVEDADAVPSTIPFPEVPCSAVQVEDADAVPAELAIAGQVSPAILAAQPSLIDLIQILSVWATTGGLQRARRGMLRSGAPYSTCGLQYLAHAISTWQFLERIKG